MTVEELIEGLLGNGIPQGMIDAIPPDMLEGLAKTAEEHPTSPEAGINMVGLILLLKAEGFDQEDGMKIIKEIMFNSEEYRGDEGLENLQWLIKKTRLGID